MFKRTFKVVFRSVRNNFVLLPEIYYNIVSTYDTGCLSLEYNGHTHFMSWAPHAGAVKDAEIGINARVAKEIGLNESDLVKCQLVADVMVLRNVFVTPVSAQDWEIIEMSSEKMSETVLQQTRIVNRNQILIIWINKSVQIALTVDRLKPILSYGRMDHTTELIVAPNIFKAYDTNTSNKDTATTKEKRLLHSKTAIHCNTYESEKFGENLARSHTSVNVKQLPQSQSVANRNRQEKIERIKKDLLRELTRSSEFRVIAGLWHERTQISDIYISKNHQEFTNVDLNTLYGMKTLDNNEYYVRLKVSSDKCEMPHTIHPTIEVNVNLMKLLNMKELEKVTLQPRPLIINFVDKIELFAHKKTHYKIIENSFKRFVMEKCSLGSNTVLLNQNEPIRLDEELIVSVGIVPEHFRYCIIDMQFLKESKIYAADIVRNVDDVINVKASVETPLSVPDLIRLPKFDAIVERLVGELKYSLCLDTNNCIVRQNNVLLSGSPGSGKTVLIERVLDQLIRKPYYCYFDIFYCTRSKGRKVESIQKDLRCLFTTCLQNAPSVLVLENLDVLAHAVGTHLTQDGEYFNRLADTINQLIVQYTNNQAIAVIASITDIQALNKRLYTPRGSHLFQTLIRLPHLEYCDRMKMLTDLCLHIQTKELDLKRIARLTEGYNQLDLVQLVERAIFYAYRLNKIHPVLTNHHLIHSLENTNVYCLHGIESHQGLSKNSSHEEIKAEDIPGLQAEVSVLEEVLRWPSKYPKIFNASPLRNQAGVLLYGPPGTGKTMLVSRLAHCWNLRMISVKGPELLAKYIGQSEENVRNIFNRARSAQPCVLFFDEFDSLAPKRGHDATGVTDRVVNQLLTELDGVESLQGVTVIAATSRPELLDPALLRSGRIDRLVEFPLPNKTARLGIFKLLSNSLNLHDSVDFEDLARKTENFTGADIQSILTSANMIAVKKALNNVHDKINNDDYLIIIILKKQVEMLSSV